MLEAITSNGAEMILPDEAVIQEFLDWANDKAVYCGIDCMRSASFHVWIEVNYPNMVEKSSQLWQYYIDNHINFKRS